MKPSSISPDFTPLMPIKGHTRLDALICSPVLLLGGTEIHMLNLARVASDLGLSAGMCVYHETDGSMVAQFRSTGIRLFPLGLHRENGLAQLAGRLRPFLREQRPAIVHIQYLAPGLVPILAAWSAGCRNIIATVHSAGQGFYTPRHRLLLRFASLFCRRFICVSKAVEQFWFGSANLVRPDEPIPASRHLTIYNAVDAIPADTIAVDKARTRQELGLKDCEVVGVVARLAHGKGHEFLLHALAKIAPMRTNLRVLCIGDGPRRTELQRLAESLGISKHILWMGERSHAETIKLYTAMDVLAVPSEFEGFGLSAAEAMAAGVPVVATSVGGLPEVVVDGTTGYLVGPGDSERLALRLVELLANRETSVAMGNKGRATAHRLFSYESLNQCMGKIYSECLAGDKRVPSKMDRVRSSDNESAS